MQNIRLVFLLTPVNFFDQRKKMFLWNNFCSAYYQQFYKLIPSHLPEYLVAAFVKRLARLSLHAPAPCIPLILDFITNLLVQHPGVQKLVKRNDGPIKYDQDPYRHEETDPLKCQAIDSMLWEIKTLQRHAIPEISIHAQLFEKPIPRVEKDLDVTLNWTYDDVSLHTMFLNRIRIYK